MRSLLAGALLCAACLVLVPTAAVAPAYASQSCPGFVTYSARNPDGSTFHYVATHVRRTGTVTCAAVRRMIRSTYGAKGGYKRAYPKNANGESYGRVTVYWRGGWRCSNGAGGAGCSNVTHPSWSVSADVGIG